MKSEDAIFFDKNVEASIPIVPRMLRLFLPDVDEDEDDDDDDEGEDDDDDVVEIVPCMLRLLLPDTHGKGLNLGRLKVLAFAASCLAWGCTFDSWPLGFGRQFTLLLLMNLEPIQYAIEDAGLFVQKHCKNYTTENA